MGAALRCSATDSFDAFQRQMKRKKEAGGWKGLLKDEGRGSGKYKDENRRKEGRKEGRKEDQGRRTHIHRRRVYHQDSLGSFEAQ